LPGLPVSRSLGDRVTGRPSSQLDMNLDEMLDQITEENRQQQKTIKLIAGDVVR